AGKYVTDCSGFVDLLLRHVSPDHLKNIQKLRTHKRQLADDYYETFANADNASDWKTVVHVADAVPGDILAWKNPEHVTGEHTNTGHVMIIDSTPKEHSRAGQKMYELTVIDCSSSGHGSDTRKKGESGIGRGKIWLDVDNEGRAIGYHWSSPSRAAKNVP